MVSHRNRLQLKHSSTLFDKKTYESNLNLYSLPIVVSFFFIVADHSGLAKFCADTSEGRERRPS